MLKNNPMQTPEGRVAFRRWRESHPEKAAEIHQQLLRGQRRLQRDKPSGLERRLRDILANLGVEHEPAYLVKPRFIVDIRIDALIIQADGDYWHGHPRFEPLTERQLAQQRRDRAQDAYLTKCGFTVVRIWECELDRAKVISILNEHGISFDEPARRNPTP